MVLKIYGHPISTCTRRVITVCNEKNVPFELVTVDLSKREHKDPAFVAKQPFGQIPYLDDDGFIVYESRAICDYIARKYADQGTPLIPTGLKAQAIHSQAIFVEIAHFNEYAEKAVAEKIFKPWRGLTPDEKVFQDHIANLSVKLDIYNDILGRQKYIAGNEVTLADLSHLPYGSLLAQAGSDIMSQKPNVAQWFKDISSRPSWVAALDNGKSTAV